MRSDLGGLDAIAEILQGGPLLKSAVQRYRGAGAD
jgi:hypothetical protein